ncbi:di-trans,poly-cis-decaprenylcistransferase [Alishewanella sp. 16-MA]|uniref:Ditrans,polycis-undecaprenyl-diphosphate synthase ((2E,6E)-farnesyl-diphosphate specific) n=1 Tax=Alishewanella maricola TaxID=2795740 RepID=A0ABS8C011_9ALTE|nr:MULTISPECIES: polyprenyl diphosphate synthase [Gammaproteobacteria]MDP4945373.1 polyprenyl diphosphate synthase [Alishewanella sp.]MDP5207294.1 polyprenyl diphosphate synthase [Alishewanella sp. SMS9]MCB5225644.1 di-trans,poly-cis-decaprenylcistransferase [Alishewanella maricola]MCC5451576.1 di-trans,poly-cis-decaprenylcistransferase [Rheinheimera sp. UJ51]MCF4008084.1 polyprenyl diphosphate synthase [Rheinheimera sp. UJ63]
MTAVSQLKQQALPQHVAIIMDGNGRWAERQSKPRVWGHKKGVEAVRRSVSFCRELGIPSLTLFAFSSENWRRPEEEVSTLMQLFMLVLQKEVKSLHKNNIRLKIIGDLSAFSDKLVQNIKKAEALTAANTAMTLNIAANYGGRWDIVAASRQLAEQVQQGKLTPAEITEQLMAREIQMADQPELDLLIRTGGDLRISNFLLWQAAYAELWFTETLWPDFDQQVFSEAIATFINRERRFGCTGAQIRELAAENKG